MADTIGTPPLPRGTLALMNEGSILSLREASKRYQLPLGCLSRWVKADLIRVHTHPAGPGRPMLLFASDVAACKQAYEPGKRGGQVRRMKAKLAS